MTGGGGRSRSKRDTPEPDTPIREKMPIGEAGESFPQLVDSSVGVGGGGGGVGGGAGGAGVALGGATWWWCGAPTTEGTKAPSRRPS